MIFEVRSPIIINLIRGCFIDLVLLAIRKLARGWQLEEHTQNQEGSQSTYKENKTIYIVVLCAHVNFTVH